MKGCSSVAAAAAADAFVIFIVIVQLSLTAANSNTSDVASVATRRSDDAVQGTTQQHPAVRTTRSTTVSTSVTATTALTATSSHSVNVTLSNHNGSANVESADGVGGDAGKKSPESSKTKLFVGMAMGFGVIIALVVVLCIVWRFCCKMMSPQASGKVQPANDDYDAANREDDTEGL